MKRVGNCWYVHKSNADEILANIDISHMADVVIAMEQIKEREFHYEVIKYDKAKHQITFIDSPDWITANEPEVGDAMMLKMKQDWEWRFIPKRKKNPQIYHCKELFVSEDYNGFDVKKAKERTKMWNSIVEINKSKIGNLDYWLWFLKEHNIDI